MTMSTPLNIISTMPTTADNHSSSKPNVAKKQSGAPRATIALADLPTPLHAKQGLSVVKTPSGTVTATSASARMVGLAVSSPQAPSSLHSVMEKIKSNGVKTPPKKEIAAVGAKYKITPSRPTPPQVKKQSPTPVKSVNEIPGAIKTPNEIDILFGRGGESNNASGNHRYQKVIEEWSHEYSTLTSRKAKTQLAWKIYMQLKQEGARFLKREKGNPYWTEAPEDDCRKKISQRLRERALEVRDKLDMENDAASCLLMLKVRPSASAVFAGSSPAMPPVVRTRPQLEPEGRKEGSHTYPSS